MPYKFNESRRHKIPTARYRVTNQIDADADVASLTADGAYDGEAVYDAVADRYPEAAGIIPPRATAVPSETTATQRDQHIAETEKHGRIGWQRPSGYNRRSLVETGMYRYTLTARSG
jgi:transposase